MRGSARNGEDSPQVLVGSSMRAEGGDLSRELRTFRVFRNLRPVDNPFLQDHVIGGRPVLPAACVMSWMADGCEQFYPGYRFVRCEDYRTLKGIAFDENAAEDYCMEIEEARKGDSGEIEFAVQVSSRPPRGKDAFITTAVASCSSPGCPRRPFVPGSRETNLRSSKVPLCIRMGRCSTGRRSGSWKG